MPQVIELFGLVRRESDGKEYLVIFHGGKEVLFHAEQAHNGYWELEDEKQLFINGFQITSVLTDDSGEANVVHYMHAVPLESVDDVEIR